MRRVGRSGLCVAAAATVAVTGCSAPLGEGTPCAALLGYHYEGGEGAVYLLGADLEPLGQFTDSDVSEPAFSTDGAMVAFSRGEGAVSDSGPMDPLVDVLVHGQDTEAAAAPLAYVATNPFFGAPAGLAQLRLVATDTGATLGEGSEEVRGTTDDLLLVATGRSAGLTHLAGAGVDRLTGRFPAVAC